MVQLFIKLDKGKASEWTIIELQGDLECTSTKDSLNGKFIGDLHFTKQGEPLLIVGHHILSGKFIQLDKPLAVLVKENSSDVEMEDVHLKEETTDSKTHFAVKAVIRRKIVFRTRPRPIVTNVPKSS